MSKKLYSHDKQAADKGLKRDSGAIIRNKNIETEEKYKFIVNAYGEMMTLINRQYIYELVNDSWCKTFGKKRDNIIGKTVAEVWGNERFESEIKKKIDKCLLGNIFREEDSFKIAEGKKKYYEVTYYPYRNYKNEISHVVGVTNDITFRKEAEKALKTSEKKLRILNDKKDKYLSVINSDLENASKYVRSLLPDEVNTNHLKINWRIIPSTHLGGDSLGYHWIDAEHLALYLLDVTGHGVGAALHSVSALNILKYETLLNTNFRIPHEVLKGLNHVFQMNDHNSLFITMWYLVYNKSTRELSYAGAGHPPLIIFTPVGLPIKMTSQNTIIGVDDQFKFRSDTIKIEDNTEVYIYSDGAYEVKLPDEKFMNTDHLADYLLENRNINAEEIDKLYDYLLELNMGCILDDDFTMVKIGFF